MDQTATYFIFIFIFIFFSLIYSSKDLSKLIPNINDDLLNLNDWFMNNKLTVNTKKITYIIFRSSQHSVPSVIPPINYNNRSIQSCKSTRFLGIFLDDTLSWKNHINH